MTARKRNENYDYRAAANQYANLADDFLRVYFVLGVNNVRLNVRYFIMAHCLELAFKASLANRSVPIDYGIHNLAIFQFCEDRDAQLNYAIYSAARHPARPELRQATSP